MVATQLMRQRASRRRELLAAEGIDVEVIDPRTLVPFDIETVRRERRAAPGGSSCVQEAPPPASWGATLAAVVVGEGFDLLDAPPVLVSGDDTPIPYAGSLEEQWVPSAARIAGRVRQVAAD